MIYVEVPEKVVYRVVEFLQRMGLGGHVEKRNMIGKTNSVVPYLAEQLDKTITYATNYVPAYIHFETQKQVDAFRGEWADWAPVTYLTEDDIDPIVVEIPKHIVKPIMDDVYIESKRMPEPAGDWFEKTLKERLEVAVGRKLYPGFCSRWHVRFRKDEEQEAILFRLSLA